MMFFMGFVGFRATGTGLATFFVDVSPRAVSNR